MNNNPGHDERTRSFTKAEADGKNNGYKLDTAANIKKATAKKAIKNSASRASKVLKGVLYSLITLILLVMLCGIIVGTTFAIYAKNNLFDPEFDIQPSELRQDLNMTSYVYYNNKYTDENGESFAPTEIYGTENRSWVTYNQMPKDLVNAFIAIEDERFWEHNGVDWKRTAGAVLSFATGNNSYGGSTITQQLIKNVTGEDDTSIQRKVTEISRALTLETKRSDEEILEMYLNRIHLSRSNYGVWAAAKYYFGKDITEETLTLVECAALASIPKSPTKYDPVRNPEFNKERRKLVLDKMLELKMIDKQAHEEAVNADIKLNITYEQAQVLGKYSYFTDALIEQIVADLGEQYGYTRQEALALIYSGGLKIYSTEDPYIQSVMEEVFEDENTFKKVDDGLQPQSAMVVMDPYTGEVKGIVGGRGEKEGRLDLNRATMSKRQVGSSIKPLTVYAPAFDTGVIDSFTTLDDSPIYMENMNKYWPSNSPGRYFGHVTVNEAIIRSKNTTAVKIVKDGIGVDYSYKFATKKLHLDSLVSADKDIAPLALGGFTNGLTVMEMTAAYSIFPSGGYYSPPRLYTKVLANDGTILLDARTNDKERAIKEETATIMTKHLENVVWSGTAASIQLKRQVNCAGKTGTTNDNKDLYYCGFTPYYVGACWFGYDIPKSLYRFSGNPAMVAWEKVMEKVHKPIFDDVAAGTATLKKFDYDELETFEYCIDSGKAPSEACALDPRGSRVAVGYYMKGDEPPKGTCDAHVIVEWCSFSNMVANDYCPNVVPKALVREYDRSFMHGDVLIEDAKYTYRDVDYIPYDEIPDTAPFYKGTLAEGESVGYSEYTAGEAINAMCRAHGPHTVGSETEEQTPTEDLGGFEVNDNDFDTTLDRE